MGILVCVRFVCDRHMAGFALIVRSVVYVVWCVDVWELDGYVGDVWFG